MKIIRTVAQLRAESAALKAAGLKIGFVPTMGYLHDGHLSLIDRIRPHCDRIAVSIFVNPAQFNQRSDFEHYPTDTAKDISLLESRNTDLLFMPSTEEIYPDGNPGIRMEYPGLSDRLCGAHRPGHFSGVLLIVHNLLEWLRPDVAIFGEKDFQQLFLIRRMVKDLSLPVNILSGPIVREESGLAMSSRNARLSASERKEALKISASLFAAAELVKRNSSAPVSAVREILERTMNTLRVEYAGCYDQADLSERNADEKAAGSLAAIAAWVGEIRLIDNMML